MRVLTQRGPGQSRLPSPWSNRLLPLAAAALPAMMLSLSRSGMRFERNHWEQHFDGPVTIAAVSGIGVAEIVLLYAVLRPWSYHRNWRRALAAALIFAPWTAFLLAVSLRGVMAAHALWLLAVTVGLFVTANLSFSAERRFGRQR